MRHFVKVFLGLVITALLTSSAFARKDDNCDKLNGIWFGTYTLKQAEDCQKSNGCTHGVNVIISRLGDTNFHADARTMQGTLLSAFNMTCKANVIRILTKGAHATLQMQCTERNICLARYEDEKVMSMLLNLKM